MGVHGNHRIDYTGGGCMDYLSEARDLEQKLSFGITSNTVIIMNPYFMEYLKTSTAWAKYVRYKYDESQKVAIASKQVDKKSLTRATYFMDVKVTIDPSMLFAYRVVEVSLLDGMG